MSQITFKRKLLQGAIEANKDAEKNIYKAAKAKKVANNRCKIKVNENTFTETNRLEHWSYWDCTAPSHPMVEVKRGLDCILKPMYWNIYTLI